MFTWKSNIKEEPFSINVIDPKPFQEIDMRFPLVGWVSKEWLINIAGSVDNRLFVEYLDIDGKVFIGTTLYLHSKQSIFSIFTKKYFFGQMEGEIMQISYGAAQRSHGRITLQISGHDENSQSIFIPVIVKQFITDQTNDTVLIEKHANVGKKIIQYKNDLKEYYKELGSIRASRKAKDDNKDPLYLHGENVSIAFAISKILEDSDESFGEYEYTEEDERERELGEKYKDALNWRGPLLGGLVSQFGGFELRVYSGDHDSHFHVIHKGKGVNARFSFPEMRLINYKNSRSTIGSNQEAKIREYCLNQEIFEKFEKEFKKRTQG